MTIRANVGWALCAALAAALTCAAPARAQTASAVKSAASGAASFDAETLRHFQALVRMDTSDPPGNEQPAVDYLQGVLDKEGIPVQIFTKQPGRPNLVARLQGNGRKRPLLIMGHTDVVNVDPAKWTHPPFSAERDGGYIYGRGTLDDRPHVVGGLMALLELKRNLVPLDRDVIFLAEAGEEGNPLLGAEYMVNEHFDAIDAEYCLAEGAAVARQGGKVRYAAVETAEKVPNGIDMIARGPSGHGSRPLQTNAIVHLSRAIVAVTTWQPPVVLNDTTRVFFQRLAEVSAPEAAKHYRDVLSADPAAVADADAWLRANEPNYASMLRTSVSPNIVQGGYRNNVIPSEAKATLDVRFRPGESYDQFLAELTRVVGDPAVELRFNGWPPSSSGKPRPAGISRIDNEAFSVIEGELKKHYGAIVVPTMSTGATDMAFVRSKGVQCYGFGPGADEEDGPKGFGAHSDQERILEAELYRFVHLTVDLATALASATPH
jgi:acetylornithine deacetylase/succinyl-diaminopimelate desuccinylase-like protein